MPRHPIGDKPMTAAERQRRWRERLRQEQGPKPDTDQSARAELTKARQEIERLHQQLAAATKQASLDDAAALAQTKAHIAELEKTGTAAAAEIAALKAKLYAAQMESVGERFAPRQRPAAKPKAEKPPLPPDEARDRQIKSLKTQVRNLKQELLHAEHHYKDAIVNAGGMPRETRLAIDKALQPDARDNATEAQRDAACKAWNVWKNDNDKAARRRAR